MDITTIGRLAFYEALYTGTDLNRRGFWHCLEAAGFEDDGLPVDIDLRAAIWRLARDVAQSH